MEEVVEGGDFLLEFNVLLPGVLLEFHFLLQDCLLVTEVTHAINETL